MCLFTHFNYSRKLNNSISLVYKDIINKRRIVIAGLLVFNQLEVNLFLLLMTVTTQRILEAIAE